MRRNIVRCIAGFLSVQGLYLFLVVMPDDLIASRYRIALNRYRLALNKDGSGSVTLTSELTKESVEHGWTTARLKSVLEAEMGLKRPGVVFIQSRAQNGNEYISAMFPFQNVEESNNKEAAGFQLSFEEIPNLNQCVFRFKRYVDPSLLNVHSLEVQMPGRIFDSNKVT
ncbi:MAG: hypothetical protein HYR55_04990 [Acidobacteria bacterium]|nr:hypothetical protein [Acidobacteriota bacterium]